MRVTVRKNRGTNRWHVCRGDALLSVHTNWQAAHTAAINAAWADECRRQLAARVTPDHSRPVRGVA